MEWSFSSIIAIELKQRDGVKDAQRREAVEDP
jgi:hypothetical protein